MTDTRKGHIALFAAQVIYALNYTIAKGLMPQFMGPMAVVFYRILGATLLFWITSLFVPREPVSRKDLRSMVWLSLFGVVINQVFFIYGLNLTTPINSSIIMISNPIMVFIFTLVLTRERLSLVRFAGLAVAVSGALLILSFRGNFQVGSDTVAGDAFTLVNAMSWGIFIVLVKPIMEKYSTVTAMKWLFLFGSVFILPIGALAGVDTAWSAMTPGAWWAIAFVVVGTTFLAYLLNLYGLRSLSSNTVSAYIYLQPFLATLFAIAIGKDTITPTKVLSGILIIFGLYLVNKRSTAA